jgi:exo-beta-1,3-glucanase (GH17 family)
MSGGYTASGEAMSTASKKITPLAEDLPDKNTDLPGSPINAQGFGQAHGDHAQKYTTGVQTLWAAIGGYSNTLKTYGTNIGTGGKAYTDAEHAQGAAVSKAGTQ